MYNTRLWENEESIFQDPDTWEKCLAPPQAESTVRLRVGT